jgi:hypothetical protein
MADGAPYVDGLNFGVGYRRKPQTSSQLMLFRRQIFEAKPEHCV